MSSDAKWRLIRSLRAENVELYRALRSAHDDLLRARTGDRTKECWCIYCERARELARSEPGKEAADVSQT